MTPHACLGLFGTQYMLLVSVLGDMLRVGNKQFVQEKGFMNATSPPRQITGNSPQPTFQSTGKCPQPTLLAITDRMDAAQPPY